MAPPPAFKDLTVEEKVVAVVQLAVNSLGSIFIAAICAFELVAFAIAKFPLIFSSAMPEVYLV